MDFLDRSGQVEEGDTDNAGCKDGAMSKAKRADGPQEEEEARLGILPESLSFLILAQRGLFLTSRMLG